MDRIYAYFPRLRERNGPAGFLSGGEQQMLAIGRALMTRPKLMLLDQPSMGLAPILMHEVFGVMRQLSAELGLSMLLVEQHASQALRLATRGFVMERGRVVLGGDTAELISSEDVKRSYLGVDSDMAARLYRSRAADSSDLMAPIATHEPTRRAPLS